MEFNGRSEFRELGDIVPIAPIEEISVYEDRRKVVSLLKEALEILEREK